MAGCWAWLGAETQTHETVTDGDGWVGLRVCVGLCVCRLLLLFLTRLRDDDCDDNHRCIAMSRGLGYVSSKPVWWAPAVSSMIRGTENTNCVGMAGGNTFVRVKC